MGCSHVATAVALLEQANTELELPCARAPFDAVVLKVGVRAGEYAGPPSGDAHIVLGRDSAPQVRAEFDEVDISRWAGELGAVAVFRGAPQQRAELRLLRVEPVVIPKTSFSGASLERVDTRVMPAVYSFKHVPALFHIGQQVDVFVAPGQALKQEG